MSLQKKKVGKNPFGGSSAGKVEKKEVPQRPAIEETVNEIDSSVRSKRRRERDLDRCWC